jgi:hypothetical protein
VVKLKGIEIPHPLRQSVKTERGHVDRMVEYSYKLSCAPEKQ